MKLRRATGAAAWIARRPVLWVGAAFLALTFGMDALAPHLGFLFPPGTRLVYSRASFPELVAAHAILTGAASLVAITLGVAAALFATRPMGRAYAGTLDRLGALAQTFPPVAVLALAVPSLSYGALPTAFALVLYGVLPVMGAGMAGLRSVPAPVLEAADGSGFSPAGRLWRIELPLAAPILFAGIRTSVTIGIGTATIGSTVGALTLGSPIIDGLSGGNPAYVLQGTVLVALFAVTVDLALGDVQRALTRRAR
ncbi:ABC transporter permease [Ancylobacter polymorphus]|uniref:ABC transporter permease n=1 Tax=Ancylobacter polymorphus TaxID=223390 RepID=A0A9E7D750_9HYPH|nr:ABC transporter permease [Ancylobacter polymorphus]UOK71586.1 ABC transporter permease [Ancylobacter polymorphus]